MSTETSTPRLVVEMARSAGCAIALDDGLPLTVRIQMVAPPGIVFRETQMHAASASFMAGTNSEKAAWDRFASILAGGLEPCRFNECLRCGTFSGKF